MEKKYTICRLCSACCPVEVYLENNKIISVERKNSTSSIEENYFCPKLKAASEIVYSPKRVKTPLIKKKINGKTVWNEASWEQTLDIIATKLALFKQKYGAESVSWLRGQAPDWGATWHYAIRFMNAFGSPNVIGNGSVCHWAREMAHVFTYGAMTSADYKNSKCIVIWGGNNRDTKLPSYDRIIYAKEQGAKLIVIDPVRTKLASLADIWLQIKPGCDGLLAMSMIYVIISENLYDSDFVREWTVGFDELKEAAKEYVPEKIAGKIWLDAEKVKEAARLYATTKPACLSEGNGVEMHLNTSQNMRAICILRILTGNVDKKGGDRIPQPIPVKDIRLNERLRNDIRPVGFEYPLLNNYPKGPGGTQSLPSLVDAILDKKPYPIKALIIQGANPAVTMANSKRFLQALKKLEFIVVIDLFMTQTAKLADIILPTTTSFEKTQLNSSSMNGNRIMLQNKVIEWVGNSWPDWKITFELAKKMGYRNEFPWNTVEEAIDYQLEPAGITVEILRNNSKGIVFEETRYEKYKKKGFDTRSGKAEICSEIFKEHGYLPIPDFEQGEEKDISFYNKKESFPLIGISGARSINFVHSQFRNIPYLLEREPVPFIDIHPKDAKTRAISDGDIVRIETPNGHIKMKAKVSDVVHYGLVRIAWGWGEFSLDYNINSLTNDEERDPITSTTSNRCFMCNIVKEERIR
jgi:anaerobic selenocysteine-containing dehydrogenase